MDKSPDSPISDTANMTFNETLTDLTQSSQSMVQWIDALLEEVVTGSLDSYSGSVEEAYNLLKSTLGESPDVVIRRFQLGQGRWPAMIVFEDGQVDNAIVDRDTMMMMEIATPVETDPKTLFDAIHYHFLTVGHVTTGTQWSELLPAMFLGMTLLFIDGVANVLMLDSVKFPARGIGRSESEPSIKGPQEGFTEVLLTQMNQLRRRLPSANLQFEPFKIGTESHTTVLVCYLKPVVNPAIVDAVKKRMGGISRASIQTSNEVGEYLTDRRLTIFPQLRMSDRVDLVARNLSQGKVAILTANDPTALILPNTLMDFYQTTQDYVFPFWDGSLARIVRLVGLLVGLYSMPLYIALSSVNPDLVSLKLLLTVTGARQGMPFPPIVEVIIMWFIIEILREAANRLPRQMATTIGTVGAVVVGTAIVRAGLIDAIMIIIVTITALGLYTVPAIEMASTWRWLFWIFIGVAWLFGIYGIVLFTVVVIIHLTSLDNFGVPYFSPFGPIRLRDMKDAWIRFPFPDLLFRPRSLRTLNPRQAKSDPAQSNFDLHRVQQRYRR